MKAIDDLLKFRITPVNGRPEANQIVLFCDGNVLSAAADNSVIQPRRAVEEFLPDIRNRFSLGLYGGSETEVWELPKTVDTNLHTLNLRAVLGLFNEDQFQLVSRAAQLLEWDRNHRFCGHCGSETKRHDTEPLRLCDNCGVRVYPRIAPCVLVLPTMGDKVLMGRQPSWPPGWYSALAGFVEAGETLEQTAIRECWEESGVVIDNLRYHGSQPWPFPGQLMVSFNADVVNPEITVDKNELEDARWFDIHDMPACPDRRTLSGRLIWDFVDSRLAISG